MICEHCGTEYAPIAYNYDRSLIVTSHGVMHTDQACRDILKTQLASMTKLKEEAEHKLAIEHEANRHDPVRRKLETAEAKLAMAVEGLRRVFMEDKESAYVIAREALRALGIDPSKVTL